MDKQKIFVGGMYFKRPTDLTKEKAPWVKGHISLKVADFKLWFANHTEKEWVNITLKESKDGSKLYLEEDTWTPKEAVFTPEEKATIDKVRNAEIEQQKKREIDPEEVYNNF